MIRWWMTPNNCTEGILSCHYNVDLLIRRSNQPPLTKDHFQWQTNYILTNDIIRPRLFLQWRINECKSTTTIIGSILFRQWYKIKISAANYVLALTNRSWQTNNLWPNRALANDNRLEAGRRHLMSTNVINELCVHTSLMSCLLTHFTTVSPQPHTVRPHRGTTNNTEVSA